MKIIEFMVDEIENLGTVHAGNPHMTELQKMEIKKDIWKDSYTIAVEKLINANELNRNQNQTIEKLELIIKTYEQALKHISDYGGMDEKDAGICPYGCDTPNIADVALTEAEKIKECKF